MKKYIGYILTSVLGGMIALGSFWLLSTNDKDSNIMRSSYEDSIPVYQTSNTYNASKQIVTPDFGAAAEKSVHSVVHIKTQSTRRTSVYEQFFGLAPRGSEYPVRASGSGVIVGSDGYIVTNNHVVESAEEITVTLNDKRTFDAKIVGLDPNTDLALIKVDAHGLPAIQMGDSDKLSVGEWVLAVGNPFNLTSTVTAGIVSAKARNINILGRQSSIESFIQTDAAVNKGNSGGALVDTKGNLVGINAAIASNTGSYTGYSFAIPVNIVKKIIHDLKEYGRVQRAYIGVTIRDINSKLAEEENINRLSGVYVEGIKDDGAADEAGLKKGDIIIAIDGKAVSSSGRLLELIAQQSPGDKVTLDYLRNDKRKTVKMTLKGKYGEEKILEKDEIDISAVLGATLETMASEDLEKLGVSHGVKVSSLDRGKLSAAGIREGFIITRVDKQEVKSAKELREILSNKEGGVLIEGIYPNGMRAYYGFGL